MPPVRIILIEDNQTFAQTIQDCLKDPDFGIDCVAVYPSTEIALQEIGGVEVEVALVDINLPGMNGIECITRLQSLKPSLISLILTTFDDNTMIFDALKAGASGYLLKRSAIPDIVAAIKQVVAGGAPMSPYIARQVVDFFRRSKPSGDATKLNENERAIIELFTGGLFYKEVAAELGISIDVVRSRVKSIYQKLHVHSRMEAVNKYLDRKGLSL